MGRVNDVDVLVTVAAAGDSLGGGAYRMVDAIGACETLGELRSEGRAGAMEHGAADADGVDLLCLQARARAEDEQ
jgi:hypothetical protein